MEICYILSIPEYGHGTVRAAVHTLAKRSCTEEAAATVKKLPE
jgi:hypothetical protein